MKSEQNGVIYLSYHKPWVLFDEDFLIPIHAGRACVSETKDGNISEKDRKWLMEHTISDAEGDNISLKNREYCECTSLYWVWKNVDLTKYKYIGCFQYRRQLILNDYFERAPADQEKNVYKCVHFSQMNTLDCKKIGLTDENICELMKKYDCIVPYATSLDLMNVTSVYHDWVDKIPGVHVDDLILLEKYMNKKYPSDAKAFSEYLNSPNKRMYQIFIATPKVFREYAEWLFDILFEIEPLIDTSLYTTNGRRTMGYLAEVLYGFYFGKMKKMHPDKVMECGVTYLE